MRLLNYLLKKLPKENHRGSFYDRVGNEIGIGNLVIAHMWGGMTDCLITGITPSGHPCYIMLEYASISNYLLKRTGYFNTPRPGRFLRITPDQLSKRGKQGLQILLKKNNFVKSIYNP